MTLNERCQTLSTQIDQLRETRELVAQQVVVQQRTNEWNILKQESRSLEAKVGLLTLSEEGQALVAAKRATFRQCAKSALQRLGPTGDVAGLTTDETWTRLTSSAKGLTTQLKASGKEAWRALIDRLGVPETPERLRGHVPGTPGNVALLAEYQRAYSAFAALNALDLPRNSDDLDNLSTAVKQCQRIVERMDFNVPDDVLTFLRAVQQGVATLALVTPAVGEWLRNNNQLEHYKVRSAG